MESTVLTEAMALLYLACPVRAQVYAAIESEVEASALAAYTRHLSTTSSSVDSEPTLPGKTT